MNSLGKANQEVNVSILLETLRNKVRNFAVLDKQGQLLGKVRDLIVDNQRQLNLIIAQSISQNLGNKDVLLRVHSRKIIKIDNQNKSVLIDLDKSEIKYMPENLGTTTNNQQLQDIQSVNNPISSELLEISPEVSEEVSEEKIIRLLEERLVVDSNKHKIGEVIVRKEIETRMVQVPVRREKLIVEQVSPELQQLAEINLGEEEIAGIEFTAPGWEPADSNGGLTVSGEFTSPKIASLLLNAIAQEASPGCLQVKVTILVEDESHQQKYQEWFSRCSQGRLNLQ